ncbi:HAD family phosphatase [Clostridium sp. BJN0001]|uniref:HAD family hydrolase n=1 Tax=Clostridium sp. BJN0001 TaxID=2930219 RepID=UPI001FCFC67C|nr:HAD family phosphatase [Clostridium sp. BJN0001]
MMKIKGVIFDMDGVLVDTEIPSFNAFKTVMKDYGYSMDMKFYLTLIGRNVKACKKLFMDFYGDDIPFDEIYKKKRKISIDTVDNTPNIAKKGLDDIMRYLKDNGYKIAVATSTSRGRASELLDRIGVLNISDYLICGDQVVNSKPNPEIFLKAAAGLKLDVDNCLVIEDSDAGVIAASRASIKSIQVPDLKKLEKTNENLPIAVLNDLSEVKEYLIKNN